jgi:hypothetical protein
MIGKACNSWKYLPHLSDQIIFDDFFKSINDFFEV